MSNHQIAKFHLGPYFLLGLNALPFAPKRRQERTEASLSLSPNIYMAEGGGGGGGDLAPALGQGSSCFEATTTTVRVPKASGPK